MIEGGGGIAGLRTSRGSFFEVLRLACDFACFIVERWDGRWTVV
jgi:hypothetical protein